MRCSREIPPVPSLHRPSTDGLIPVLLVLLALPVLLVYLCYILSLPVLLVYQCYLYTSTTSATSIPVLLALL